MKYFMLLAIPFVTLISTCDAASLEAIQAQELRNISATLTEIKNELKEIRKEMRNENQVQEAPRACR